MEGNRRETGVVRYHPLNAVTRSITIQLVGDGDSILMHVGSG